MTTIRNKLVHGYGFSNNIISCFSAATDNLERYAKRILLLTLGWKYHDSYYHFDHDKKHKNESYEFIKILEDNKYFFYGTNYYLWDNQKNINFGSVITI